MNWSLTIYRLKQQGYTDEQVIEYLNTPWVNAKYMAAYNDTRRYYTREDIHRRKNWRKQVRTTITNSGLSKVHLYVLKVGLEQFLKEYVEKNTRVLAEELGVTQNVVIKYKSLYVTGERRYGPWKGDYDTVTQRVELEHWSKEQEKIREEKKRLKKVRRLW